MNTEKMKEKRYQHMSITAHNFEGNLRVRGSFARNRYYKNIADRNSQTTGSFRTKTRLAKDIEEQILSARVQNYQGGPKTSFFGRLWLRLFDNSGKLEKADDRFANQNMIQGSQKYGIRMNWIKLTSTSVLGDIIEQSVHAPQVIFKHSTRCSISSMALNRIKSASDNANYYILDVLRNRDVSDMIESSFQVQHESPQLLIIYQRHCIFHLSHFAITAMALGEKINSLS